MSWITVRFYFTGHLYYIFLRFEVSELLIKLMLVGLMSALGQIFIFRAATLFGSLTLSIVTTTRKFVTAMLSIILFSHAINVYQGLALGFVVAGTGLDYYSQFIMKDTHAKKVGKE